MKGVSRFDGHAEPGAHERDKVIPPLDFANAPGGWLIAYVRPGQRLHVFIYADADEATRNERKASETLRGTGGHARQCRFRLGRAT